MQARRRPAPLDARGDWRPGLSVTSGGRVPLRALLIVITFVAGCTSSIPTASPALSPSAAASSAPASTAGVTSSSGSPVASPTGGPGTPGVDPAGSPSVAITPSASASPAPSGSGPSATPAPGAVDALVAAAMARLTTDSDLVGQVLLLGWRGNTPASVLHTIRALHPGGIVYVGSNAGRAAQARAINRQIDADAAALGLLPMFKALDQEGGSVERIRDIPNLGSNWSFGATDPTNLQACRRGATHAAQLTAMDFNMNLAPVLDVLTNPNNTVIGNRSYGSDPALVARLGANYILGLQGGGILAVGKHFPGHGDTTVDSHLGLPVVPYGRKHLMRIELPPFIRAISPSAGVSTIMVGHLALPRLDPTNTPASLSKPIVTGLLGKNLGYGGLVMTDDLGAMQAVTARYTPAQAAVKALNAGEDMLLITGDVATERVYRNALLAALASGALPRARLMDAVRHVLYAKARFGLLGGTVPSAGC